MSTLNPLSGYTITPVKTGGIEVRVHQLSGEANPYVPELIGVIVAEAQRRLSVAMREALACTCQRQVSESFRDRFRYCFGADPKTEPQHIDDVYCVLGKISHGLCRGPLTILVKDKQGRGGGVKGTEITPRRPGDDFVFEAKGPIELDRKRLLEMQRRATKTLIHEAGHFFAKLIDNAWAKWPADHEDVGWFDRSTGKEAKVEMTWENARINADSYAMFVFYLSQVELTRAEQPQTARTAVVPASKATAAPAASL